MRRKDFIFEDMHEIDKMLNSIEFGVMALPDIIPYAVPVSFCFKNNQIYFHGAMSGRKYEIPTPVNETVVEFVHAFEESDRVRDKLFE